MDSLPVIRIHDRVAGAVVPMVVVVHALGSAGSKLSWRLTSLRGSGDVETLFPEGMLALEASLPRDVDWSWLERLALLVDDLETIEFTSLTATGDSSSTISCIDSSYWEIAGPIAALDILRERFDAVEAS